MRDSHVYSLRRGTARRDAPVICAFCGRKAPRHMRGHKYCSARCRDRGRERVRKAFLAQDTGAPATPLQSTNEINPLQRAKTQSTVRIIGPADVLEVECFRGTWECATSCGRAAAGYVGKIGDCVCRAIAIPTGRPYQHIYAELTAIGWNPHKRWWPDRRWTLRPG
jgi:hypothetical protein